MRSLVLLSLFASIACSTPAVHEEDPADGSFFSGDAKEDSVNFVEEGSYDAEAVLRLVNSADFLQLFDEVGLSQTTAEAIADATKPVVSLAELDGIRHVGFIAFSKLKSHALAHEYGPGLGEEYPPAGESQATQSVLSIASTDGGGDAWMRQRHLYGQNWNADYRDHGCPRSMGCRPCSHS